MTNNRAIVFRLIGLPPFDELIKNYYHSTVRKATENRKGPRRAFKKYRKKCSKGQRDKRH
jgi:hypothetical protein